MVIVENTPARLVLRDRPVLMLAGMLGAAASCFYAVFAPDAAFSEAIAVLLVLLALGILAAAWWYAPWQRIVFDRQAGTVTHRVARLGRAAEHSLPLAAVRGVRHESDWQDDARSYRLVLETADGPWPLTAIFTGGRHDAEEAAIRDWLAAPAFGR